MDSNYINSRMDKLKKKVEGKYNLLEFHFKTCINNIEISTMLSVIEANNNEKEMHKIIFNDKIKYIGVNHL